jgi:predicted TIM-barrel fold metal-dependent hydrolase
MSRVGSIMVTRSVTTPAVPSNGHRVNRLGYDCLTHSPEALRYLIDTVGIENVYLGTDFPADMSAGQPVRAILSNDSLNDTEKRAILSDNAERMLQSLTPVANS